MELIKGNIYTSVDMDGNTKDIYIWRCNRDGDLNTNARLLVRVDSKPSFEPNVGNHGWRDYREPTYEEKAWLEACIEAKKTVPKPEISGINYEIY